MEWTPLGVVVSSSSLEVFKHSVEDHGAVMLLRRLKLWAERVWPLKYLSLGKL